MSAQPRSLEERAEILARAVNAEVSRGWRVVSQTQTQAQLVKGKPTNHILHLILTIITVGLWAIVWILMAIFGGEKHRFVAVNEYGNVSAS
jgi:hypothetical protein